MKKQLENIKSPGYNIPDNYFDSVENTILDAIKLDQALPKNDSGYITPEGYFSNIEVTILNKLDVKQDSKPKVIPLFNRKNLVYISGIAAAALIMLSIFITKEAVTFDTIEIDLVENYLSNQEMSSDELLSFLTDDVLSENEFIQNNLDEEFIDDIILDISYDDIYE